MKFGIASAAACLILAAVSQEAAAAGRNCPAPGTERSMNSSTKVVLHFANSSNRAAKLYWLDFQGVRQFYKELKPGQDYKQPSYMTHPWIAVDPKGDCIDGVMKAHQPGENVMEFFGD
jgi:hypothetical protein